MTATLGPCPMCGGAPQNPEMLIEAHSIRCAGCPFTCARAYWNILQRKPAAPRGSQEIIPQCDSVELQVGTHHVVTINKLFGPLIFRNIRIRMDAEKCQWVVEAENVAGGESWGEVVRIEGQPEGMFPDDPVPQMQCPQCGKLLDDYDGFGVLAHVAPMPDPCGFCTHPSWDGTVGGGWKCGICGVLRPADAP